jgi:hypothetical protein
MKNTYAKALTGFALVASFLIGCSLQAPSSGHLSVTVPSGSASVARAADSSGEYARIYVILNGSFTKLGSDTDYIEKTLDPSSPASISIDLPAGSGYKAYAVLGSKADGLWTPTYYGSTSSFTVSAGVYTEQTINVSVLPGTYEASSGIAGAISIDGTLWKVVGSKIVSGATDVPLSGAGTIYSLTEGLWFKEGGGFAKEPWINTSTGIWTVLNGALHLRYAIGSATYSGALTDSGTLLLFYYGSDIGYASTDNSTKKSVDSDWSTSGLKEFLLTDDGKSFKDLIGNVSTLVKDGALIINGDETYGFVATSLGTYLYNKQMKSDMGTDKDAILAWVKSQITKSSYAVSLYDAANKSASITAIAFDSASSPKYVYAGSGIGLYYADATGLSSSSTAPVLNDSNRVNGITASITKVGAATLGSSSYVAYADADGTVRVLKDRVDTGIAIPFYAYTATKNGLVDLGFYVAGETIHLTVSSMDGLMDVAL